MRQIEFLITQKDNGKQIRDFLKNYGFSTALITKLKKTENGILKNGEFARSIDFLSEGDKITVNIESSGEMPEPSNAKIEIVYEDEDILVANKPPKMPVHESRNHRGDALSNAVAAHIKENTAFRAVYRLDRDTSGLVLIAKNELAAAKLAGKIEKDYYAVVCGKIKGNSIIDLPIKRLGSSIIKRGVAPDGERAVTKYTSIFTGEKYSLLKINLETGRTHQIRVHFSHLGYPLAGDDLYGQPCEDMDRQALHCKAIRFTHPVTLEKMSIECDFPSDFKELINTAKSDK